MLRCRVKVGNTIRRGVYGDPHGNLDAVSRLRAFYPQQQRDNLSLAQLQAATEKRDAAQVTKDTLPLQSLHLQPQSLQQQSWDDDDSSSVDTENTPSGNAVPIASESYDAPSSSSAFQPRGLRCSLRDALHKESFGRVGDDEAHGAEVTHMTVRTARREVQAFQIRIAADESFSVGVNDATRWLSASHGHEPGGHVQVRVRCDSPGVALETFVLGWVRGDDGDEWPSVLDASGRGKSPAHRPALIYCRLTIGPDVDVGDHVVTVAVLSNLGPGEGLAARPGLVWTGAASLRVMDVTLPPVRERRFHLDLWQHWTALAVYYRVREWSDAHFALIRSYMQRLAELGQKAVSLCVSDAPWVGQKAYREKGGTGTGATTTTPSPYLFQHACARVTRLTAGAGETKRQSSQSLDRLTSTIAVDWHPLDRILDLASELGMDKEVELFGLDAWADDAFGFGARVRVPCHDTGGGPAYLNEDEYDQYVRLLFAHLARRGDGRGSFLRRVRVTVDEPEDAEAPAFRQRMRQLRDAAEAAVSSASSENTRKGGKSGAGSGGALHVKLCVQSLDAVLDAKTGRYRTPPEVCDVVPHLPLFGQHPLKALVGSGEGRGSLRRSLAQGQQSVGTGRISFYACCITGRPNLHVASPGVDGRLHGWLAHFLNTDGFLRWNYCLWPSDPYADVRFKSGAGGWPAGEMFLVFPGRTGTPVDTLRLEALRFAIQDFTLLDMTRRSCAHDATCAAAAAAPAARRFRASSKGQEAETKRQRARIAHVVVRGSKGRDRWAKVKAALFGSVFRGNNIKAVMEGIASQQQQQSPQASQQQQQQRQQQIMMPWDPSPRGMAAARRLMLSCLHYGSGSAEAEAQLQRMVVAARAAGKEKK